MAKIFNVGGNQPKPVQSEYDKLRPSIEQKEFIQLAKQGKNVLVDACIGSGKTTAIQKLCDSLPDSKCILYLTYNKLLKLDAQDKITRDNIMVQNYHGYAYFALQNAGISAGVSDLIQTFNHYKPRFIDVDILIIDEYQDIDSEISILLNIIKSQNPKMQLIAVGDMEQKIYDKTTLDVSSFIDQFLDNYVRLEFTQCFRLSKDYAAKLGRIWNKEIVGVNPDCEIKTMNISEVVSFLATKNPAEILCLGARTGVMAKTLNTLENDYSSIYNKHTVFASISDHNKSAISPSASSAIFTTFDSSKGMERDICVVFDYDGAYWENRLHKPQQSYNILRNIFLVAASRGKRQIIFVNNGRRLLDEETLSDNREPHTSFNDTSMADLFAFKYKEDVEKSYSLLNIKALPAPDNNYDIIDIKMNDGLIDLSPCISTYQTAAYFNGYDIDTVLDLLYQQIYHIKLPAYQKAQIIDKKVLLDTSLRTGQKRYIQQVDVPWISNEAEKALFNRIQTRLSQSESAMIPSTINFSDNGKPLFSAQSYGDAIKDNVLYNLVFTDEISHEVMLETACTMIGADCTEAVLWNIRDNTSYQIRVNNPNEFLTSVLHTATKGEY